MSEYYIPGEKPSDVDSAARAMTDPSRPPIEGILLDFIDKEEAEIEQHSTWRLHELEEGSVNITTPTVTMVEKVADVSRDLGKREAYQKIAEVIRQRGQMSSPADLPDQDQAKTAS